jgi:hypothetical protein
MAYVRAVQGWIFIMFLQEVLMIITIQQHKGLRRQTGLEKPWKEVHQHMYI